jgi:hypothetical protein
MLLLATDRNSRRRRSGYSGTTGGELAVEGLGEAKVDAAAGKRRTVAGEEEAEGETERALVGVGGRDEAIASAFCGISSVNNLAEMGGG